jgi:hypothetical protein
MKTLTILWKRFWAESPAILLRLSKIVLRISIALSATAAAGLLLIQQFGVKVEWTEYFGVLGIASGVVTAFILGLKLSTSDISVQKLSDPETGLPNS